MTRRIEQRFAALKKQGRSGFVTFLCGGDPDPGTFETLLKGLPEAGADVIEIGMPFTDPMADGPSIQAGALRALHAGTTLPHLLECVARFRSGDDCTPLVLMGYYNPIHAYGRHRFVDDARAAGVDGLLVVDLPPEEDAALFHLARPAGLDFIRLASPTTDDRRLPRVLRGSTGFLYYISITGITGAAAPSVSHVEAALARIRRRTDLPIAVGFGIREPSSAAEVARIADAAVVGSALVDLVGAHLDRSGHAMPGLVSAVHGKVRALSDAVRGARTKEAAE